MDHWSQLYFGFCAALAIAGALITIIAPNPIRGAMGLLLMIVSVAGLFLALHAQFLAAIQLIVYAGAIVVLFLFVIMLLGPDATPPHDKRGTYSLVVRGGTIVTLPPVGDEFGGIDQFGRELFSYALVPFELSSALLMVAVIGAVAVARGNHISKKRSSVLEPPAAPKPGGANLELEPHGGE